jgi:hypothetical protein
MCSGFLPIARGRLVSFSLLQNWVGSLGTGAGSYANDVIPPGHELGIAGWKIGSECGVSAAPYCPKFAKPMRLLSAVVS